MPKLTLILVLILLTSCDSEPMFDIRWGPNPRVACGNWLEFDYDKAIYFYDTCGTLYQHDYNDSIVNLYRLSHKGKVLTSQNINDLNAILSCKMYCGTSNDSIFATLNNPEHLVTFVKEKRVIGYISVDFYSGTIKSLPTTKSNELCALDVFFQSIRKQ